MGIHLVKMFDAYWTGTSRGVGREMDAPGVRRLHRYVQRADLKAVADVRRMLRDALLQWGAEELTETAELLTSELVTNALVHTDDDALFVAVLTGEGPARRLRVEVRDDTPHRAYLRHPDGFAVSGRGLLLVQSLADAWGTRAHGGGKAIWFELTERPD
ncbi:ATP-binding protein [Wenjunlia tyrosinilytica]|nr:ATP-binding protein [Wenjunlia tyrosinilytica]